MKKIIIIMIGSSFNHVHEFNLPVSHNVQLEPAKNVAKK